MPQTVHNTNSVYESLKQRIIKGVFSPSENLTEMELSKYYNVSRNTVKKALLMLERENLVSIEPNKGAKVRAYTLKEVLEYLEIRAVLEGLVVTLTVPSITGPEIATLEQALLEMQAYKENRNLVGYSEGNQRFHQILYDACPNQILVDMVKTLKNQMSKYNTKTILIPGRDEQSLQEHAAILEAVKLRDVVRAGESMQTHIAHVKQTFEANHSLLM